MILGGAIVVENLSGCIGHQQEDGELQPMSAELEQKVLEIRQRFIGRMAAREQLLVQLISRLQGAEMQGAAEELRALAHTLAGAAGSFGFEDISLLADEVEAEAMQVATGVEKQADKLRAACNRLRDEISHLSIKFIS